MQSTYTEICSYCLTWSDVEGVAGAASSPLITWETDMLTSIWFVAQSCTLHKNKHYLSGKKCFLPHHHLPTSHNSQGAVLPLSTCSSLYQCSPKSRVPTPLTLMDWLLPFYWPIYSSWILYFSFYFSYMKWGVLKSGLMQYPQCWYLRLWVYKVTKVLISPDIQYFLHDSQRFEVTTIVPFIS